MVRRFGDVVGRAEEVKTSGGKSEEFQESYCIEQAVVLLCGSKALLRESQPRHVLRPNVEKCLMSVDKVMRLTLACLAMASVWMCAAPAHAVWVTEWQLGRPGQGWAPPVAGLGGPDVTFVREQGASNPLPATPTIPRSTTRATTTITSPEPIQGRLRLVLVRNPNRFSHEICAKHRFRYQRRTPVC